MGKLAHLKAVAVEGKADAAAMAHVLHYRKLTIPQIRDYALLENLPVRAYS